MSKGGVDELLAQTRHHEIDERPQLQREPIPSIVDEVDRALPLIEIA